MTGPARGPAVPGPHGAAPAGRLVVTTRAVEASSTPLLERAGAGAWCWVREGEGLVADGEAVRLAIGTGTTRFTDAAASLATLAGASVIDDAVGVPGSGLIALGAFTFDPRVGGSVLVVPRIVRGRRDGREFVTRIDPDGAAPFVPPAATAEDGPGPGRPRFGGSTRPDHAWLAAVAEAIELVRSGALDKVVLARDHLLWSERPFDVRRTVLRLAERYPSCHTFHVDGLVGATPELLVSRTGRDVASRVLAGTAARGRDAAEDAAMGGALLSSTKDRSEHALAVSSVTDVLSPRSTAIEVDGPRLLRLENVQHLATDVRAALAEPGATALELVGALHPTAAVGGSPRAEALEAIARLEGMDRGRYTGPVGWTDASGDGEWGIALRCAELAGTRARLFAGAGIVAASVPEDELAETRLKLAAMRGVLGDTPP